MTEINTQEVNKSDLPTGPSLALLICTMDRPDVLKRCLESIVAGQALPLEIIVSDDSPDGQDTEAICSAFPNVRYIKGPGRGLCANRNAIIRQSRADFLSLLDDDAVVSSDFIKNALGMIGNVPEKTLITGRIYETEDLQGAPNNRSFLGFFGNPPKTRFENIHLNCNLIPRAAFDEVQFDERIAYGYEDMDVCSQLLVRGYSIRYEPSLINWHLPPRRNLAKEKERFTLAERARFYTSVKFYMLWQRNFPALITYILAAPAHRVLHAVKSGKWYDLSHAFTDMIFAVRSAWEERAAKIT